MKNDLVCYFYFEETFDSSWGAGRDLIEIENMIIDRHIIHLVILVLELIL